MNRNDSGIGLYIHIPFCKKKCLYCDFPSYQNKEDQMDEYVEALCKETDNIKSKKIKTIYIGGGTPTYLSLDSWEKLGESINRLNLADDLEFSVECNPGTGESGTFKILKDIGVNRLSIGMQAWQDKLLQKLGRIHSVQDFMNTYENARNVGFDNINIDLMYGIPNQKLSDWRESLEKTVEIKPEHISCYSLIIEEGTPFYSMYEEDKLKLPTEDEEREMNNITRDYLLKNNYQQYEISNYSLHNKQCRHNLIYWSMENYIGCGVSAHSYNNGIRYENENSIDKYIAAINKKGIATIKSHENSIKDDMEEFMFLGLRKTEGVNVKEFKEKYGNDIMDIYRKVIDKYISNGLLLMYKNQLYLSQRGIEISNRIMSEFIL